MLDCVFTSYERTDNLETVKWIKTTIAAEVQNAKFTYYITFIASIKKLKYLEINRVYLSLTIPESTACHMDFLTI
jgi:hypothetical protein